MKVIPSKLNGRDRMKYLDALYTSAASVRGRLDMKAFLRDLLTESERVMLGRRISIARMLLAGHEYDDIIRELRVGRDTIFRVQRWLRDQFRGYEKAIRGMEKEIEDRRTRGAYSGGALLARLKKKYPLHFLLFSAPRKKSRA